MQDEDKFGYETLVMKQGCEIALLRQEVMNMWCERLVDIDVDALRHARMRFMGMPIGCRRDQSSVSVLWDNYLGYDGVCDG